jgi:hypothetical protein
MLAQSGFSSRLTLSRGSMLAKVDMVQNMELDKSVPTSFVEFWVFLLRQSRDLAHHDCLLGRSNVTYLIRARLPSTTVNEVGTVSTVQPNRVFFMKLAATPRELTSRRMQSIPSVPSRLFRTCPTRASTLKRMSTSTLTVKLRSSR